MQVIELECPSCQEELEIDAGFAGGVCRCSNCGTLMTVPEDAADTGSRPEALARPDRPDAPVQVDVPSSTGEGAVRPQLRPGLPAGPRADRSNDDPKRPQYASVSSIDLGEGNVLITTSGRRVVLDGNAIPIAARRRRPIVRFVTYAIFLAFVGVVILGTIIAVGLIITGGGGSDDELANVQIDTTVNPLLSQQPTLLGMPLASRSTVVVDASGYSQPWLDRFNRALQISLANLEGARDLQVIYWTEGRLLAYPREQHVPFTRRDRAQLHQIALDEVFPIGGSDLVPMIARAVEQAPQQVVLVTGQGFVRQDVDALRQWMLEQKVTIPIDVVAIGSRADSADFRAFVTDETIATRPGLFLPMNQNRLENWIEQWEQETSPERIAEVLDLPAVPPLPPEKKEAEQPGDARSTESQSTAPGRNATDTMRYYDKALPDADVTSSARQRADDAAARARAASEAQAKREADAKAKAEAEAKAKAEAEAGADAETADEETGEAAAGD